MAERRSKRRLRTIPGLVRVWVLIVLLVPVVALSLLGIADWQPYVADRELPWWLLIIGFYLAEVMVVHLRFRRDAHSFSMSDIPLLIGLFYADPVGVVAAGLIANVAVLAFHRRQPAVKLAFNVVQFALQAVIAMAVFRSIAGNAGPLDPISWLAALSGVLTALFVASTLINLAILMMGGSLKIRDMTEVVALEALATLINASLAVVAIVLMDAAREVAVLGFVAPVALYLAYRAYVGQREERSRLTALYDATRALHRSPQIDAAMLIAARHAQQMLEAEFAEIVLFPIDKDGTAHRAFAGADQSETAMVAVDLGGWDGLWERAAASHEGAVIVYEDPLMVGPDSDKRPVTDCIVAPIVAGSDVLGMLVVANHMSDVARFKPEDLDAVTALAGHVGVSLENGRLADSLAQLTELKEQLRQQALYDSITGLGNRVLFMERLDHALTRSARHGTVVGVLYLDLDGFKEVNDQWGHAAGDRVLTEIGVRLRTLGRAEDTVARLSGDEFALIAEDAGDPENLTTIADRLVSGLAEMMRFDDFEVTVTASIGIAVAAFGEDPNQLMRRADAAMYAAKRRGKSQYAVADHHGVVADTGADPR